MEENENVESENEDAFIPVIFLYRKHDYFVIECKVENHHKNEQLHVSKGNPQGYVVGERMVTKTQYNEWFNADYDKEEEKARIWREFSLNIPFLFEHRKEIYANSDFYYAQTPLCVVFVGRVYLGALLKAYELENSVFILPCDNPDCKGKSFVFSVEGSPISGNEVGHCICPECGKVSYFHNANFKKVMNTFFEIKKEDKDDKHKPVSHPQIQLKKDYGKTVLDFSSDEEMLPERLSALDVIHQLKN